MRSDSSNDEVGRVIPFRPRMRTSPKGQWGKAPDYSPIPDLAEYECPESDDEYRHRMTINALAFVFTSLLVLAGLWLANMMVHHV